MPKEYEALVKKLKGKSSVDSPYALAHSIRQKQGKEKPKSASARKKALNRYTDSR